ncbi:MAG TPA: helix-turn-helix domain-containing protein [Ktedonobacterales bacterium]
MASDPDAAPPAEGEFGDLLRSQRRAAGLTQEELAERAGLSVRGIADLERGARRAPRRDTVALLVRALGASPEAGAALVGAARRGHTLAHAPPAPSPPHEPPRHNLPAQTTELLGRDEAVRAVVALAQRADVRLVTATGPGGAGKTRLAIATGVELVDDFADGVWFVRLSRLTDPRLVIPTIAQTLGLQDTGGRSLAEALHSYLRERRLLLILDNFEHLAAAAAHIADLLEVSPALKVLATSRAPLRLRGEREYPVPPLAAPPAAAGSNPFHSPERLGAYPAVALFIERARSVQPNFALTATSAPAIAAICERLDGLPLAIELAAARVKLMPPAALLAQLERGLGLLAGGARDLPERQQTLDNTLAWSERLLAPDEQALFRRLAVFAGGCTLEAIEATCITPVGAAALAGEPLAPLSALVDHSLIQVRQEGGETRYSMLHVIRDFAAARLEASGEAEALRRARLHYYLGVAERVEGETHWSDQLTGRAWFERELPNLRGALAWASGRGEVERGLRLMNALAEYWIHAGLLQEAGDWYSRLLADALDAGDNHKNISAATQAKALLIASGLALRRADTHVAMRLAEQCLALARDLPGPMEADALTTLGIGYSDLGDNVQAIALLEEALASTRRLEAPGLTAATLGRLGLFTANLGQLARASAYLDEALSLARREGDPSGVSFILGALALVASSQRDQASAKALAREALVLARESGHPIQIGERLYVLCRVAIGTGEMARAARLYGVYQALMKRVGWALTPANLADLEGEFATARATLGEERWALALAAGQALALEDAIAEALGESGL